MGRGLGSGGDSRGGNTGGAGGARGRSNPPDGSLTYSDPEEGSFVDRLLKGEVKLKSVGGEVFGSDDESSQITFRNKREEEQVQAIIGKPVSAYEVAQIVGAPDNSVMDLRVTQNGRSISYSVEHPGISEYVGEIYRDKSGKLTIDVDSLYTTRSEGLSMAMAMGMMGNARANNIEVVRTTGAGSGEELRRDTARGVKPTTGFSTWANMGGLRQIDPDLQTRLRNEHGMVAKDTNELMVKYGKDGMKAWKSIGTEGRYEWDLSPGSPQIAIMNKNLSRMGKRMEL